MLYETLFAICYYFYNLQFKKVKDAEKGVLILVKLNVALLHECVSLFLNGKNLDNHSEVCAVRNSYQRCSIKKNVFLKIRKIHRKTPVLEYLF